MGEAKRRRAIAPDTYGKPQEPKPWTEPRLSTRDLQSWANRLVPKRFAMAMARAIDSEQLIPDDSIKGIEHFPFEMKCVVSCSEGRRWVDSHFEPVRSTFADETSYCTAYNNLIKIMATAIISATRTI